MNIYTNKIQPNSNSVNFTGCRTLLGKRLDKVISEGMISPDDNLFLVKELKKLLEKRMKTSQNLGEGMQNRIYKIDDKYVMRVPINRAVITDDKVILCKRKYADLKTYYGEPLAIFGNIKILKNACPKGNAIPAGIPKELPKNFDKNNLSSYYSNFYLPIFANVPQRSYDMLARDIKTLGDIVENKYIRYTFDYFNPNNVVLSGKTLKMTDEVDMTIWENKNTISDMLNVFLKQMTVGVPASPSEKLLPLRHQIAKKVIKAGMKYNVPITGESLPNSVFNYVFQFLCRAKEPSTKIFNKLEEIKNMNLSAKERCLLTDKYLDSIL